MKKMMAKMIEFGGLALVFVAAMLSDGGASFGVIVLAAFMGLLVALAGNFAAWKCDHPSRKPSVVRFRPEGAPALCGTPAPLSGMSAASMRKVG